MNELTPVLLVVYKRPDSARRALEAIASAGTRRIFVAADGPRTDADAAFCERTLEVVSQFAERLDILTNASPTNMGCGIRVHTAIEWAFTLTDRLIILEDDCIPNRSFFRFCDELLEYYAHDERVMHISGNNFAGSELSGDASYYFSKYTHAWGWATWRRAWRHFDWTISRWPERRGELVEFWCHDPYEQTYWTNVFNAMYGGAEDVWDYMWMFACWSQMGLAVLPSVNLVLNDGWGEDATHTKEAVQMPSPKEIGPIVHPKTLTPNLAADAWTFDRNFGGAYLRSMDAPWMKFRRRISPLLFPARLARRGLRRLLGRR